MNRAKQTLKEGIDSTKALFGVYDYLRSVPQLPEEYASDLLRSQIVYGVSALDRFIHELVRKGLLETLDGIRIPTPKFMSYSFSSSHLLNALDFVKQANGSTSFTIASILSSIDNEIIKRMGFLSFQDYDKISDALALLVADEHKMTHIAVAMRLPGTTDNDKQKYLKQKLRLIIERRNQITHEADIEPVSNQRRTISKELVEESLDFIETFAEEVYTIVTSRSCYI